MWKGKTNTITPTWSVSINGYPCSINNLDTDDLPLPMPPVIAIKAILMNWRFVGLDLIKFKIVWRLFWFFLELFFHFFLFVNFENGWRMLTKTRFLTYWISSFLLLLLLYTPLSTYNWNAWSNLLIGKTLFKNLIEIDNRTAIPTSPIHTIYIELVRELHFRTCSN